MVKSAIAPVLLLTTLVLHSRIDLHILIFLNIFQLRRLSFASDGSAVSSASSLSGENNSPCWWWMMIGELIMILIRCWLVNIVIIVLDDHWWFLWRWSQIISLNSDFWPGDSGDRRLSPFGQVAMFFYIHWSVFLRIFLYHQWQVIQNVCYVQFYLFTIQAASYGESGKGADQRGGCADFPR